MLDHEYDVKEYRDECKGQLGKVRKCTPIACHTRQSPASSKLTAHSEHTLVQSIDEELQEGENASCEVKQHIPDAPPYSALSLPIQINLRYVLDESDKDLHVTEVVHEGQPRCCAKGSHLSIDDDCHPASQDNDCCRYTDVLVASLMHVSEDESKTDHSYRGSADGHGDIRDSDKRQTLRQI